MAHSNPMKICGQPVAKSEKRTRKVLVYKAFRVLTIIPTRQGNSGTKQYCLGGLIIICSF